MMDQIESYILSNYTSPDFPQSYEGFIKENYQDILPEPILGDEKLTLVTNNIIQDKGTDTEYLSSLKDYDGVTVVEPEVDFLKSLALQARYIDDSEYLEWLNEDKMAKVLAEFPTRGDLIDHLGPTIEEIGTKVANDPNLDLLINNMTYKSHPLAFYEFSQSEDFSADDGDFGFREWIRKGINAIKRLKTKNKNENQIPTTSGDESSDGIKKLSKSELKEILENGTEEQKSVAREILDQNKRLTTDALTDTKNVVTGIVSAEIPAKLSSGLVNVTSSLLSGARIPPSNIKTHDPNAYLQGQVRNAWDMSKKNKELATPVDKVIANLKGKKESGKIKLEEVPETKDHSIPQGPKPDGVGNIDVNERISDRPNDHSVNEDLMNEYITDLRLKKTIEEKRKQLDKNQAIRDKVNKLLTTGDMAAPTYQYGDWIEDKKLRKQAQKYDKDQKAKIYNKSIKSAIDKENGVNSRLDKLIDTMTTAGTTMLAAKAMEKLSKPKTDKDQEIERLRLENENLKLRQAQSGRYNRDYSEDQDFDNPYDDMVEDRQHELDEIKEQRKAKDSDKFDKKEEIKVDQTIDPKENVHIDDSPKESLIKPEVATEYLKKPIWEKDTTKVSNESPKSEEPIKKSRQVKPKLTQEDQLAEAERQAGLNERASKIGKKFVNGKLVDMPESRVKPEEPPKTEEPKSRTQQLDELEQFNKDQERAKKLGKKFDKDGNLVDLDPDDKPKVEAPRTYTNRQLKTKLKAEGKWQNLNRAQRSQLLSDNESKNTQVAWRSAQESAGLRPAGSTSSSYRSSSKGSEVVDKIGDITKDVINKIEKAKKKEAALNIVKGVGNTVARGVGAFWRGITGSNNQPRASVN